MENQSPIPQTVKQNKVEMPFHDAVRCMIEGAKVTRVGWENTEEYGYIKDGFVMIHTKGKDHRWIISDGDYLAGDWILIN